MVLNILVLLKIKWRNQFLSMRFLSETFEEINKFHFVLEWQSKLLLKYLYTARSISVCSTYCWTHMNTRRYHSRLIDIGDKLFSWAPWKLRGAPLYSTITLYFILITLFKIIRTPFVLLWHPEQYDGVICLYFLRLQIGSKTNEETKFFPSCSSTARTKQNQQLQNEKHYEE